MVWISPLSMSHLWPIWQGPLNSSLPPRPLTQCQALDVILSELLNPSLYSKIASSATFLAHSLFLEAVSSFVSLEISGSPMGVSWLCVVASSLGPPSILQISIPLGTPCGTRGL